MMMGFTTIRKQNYYSLCGSWHKHKHTHAQRILYHTKQKKMVSPSVAIAPLLGCVLVVVAVVVAVVVVARNNRQGKTKVQKTQQKRRLSRKTRTKMQQTPTSHHTAAAAPSPPTASHTPLHSYYETRSAHHTPTPFPDVTVTPYAQTTNHG